MTVDTSLYDTVQKTNAKNFLDTDVRMFDQTVESKTKGWKDYKFVQNNDLYRSPLKNVTLTELISTPQSFISDVFWPKYMHLNGTCGTM